MNGVEVRVMRIFNTYGPRMLPDDGRVVSNFIVQALRGEPLTLYGDGSARPVRSATWMICGGNDSLDEWVSHRSDEHR